jgi:hypothetical protein
MEQKSRFASSAYQMLISILSFTAKKSRDDPREVVGVFGAVRGTVDYKGDYRTAATAWRDRQFFYYTE